MSVIYLQDYNPWESIGGLAGRYGGYRLGQIQNNRMAHGYQDMLSGGVRAFPANDGKPNASKDNLTFDIYQYAMHVFLRLRKRWRIIKDYGAVKSVRLSTTDAS